MVFATVPAAPPTEKNHRATSWPPPISANVPYVVASRLRASAFCRVLETALSMGGLLQWAGFLYARARLGNKLSILGRCGRERSPRGQARAEPADDVEEGRRQE